MQLTEMLSLIVKGFWETLYMTLGSTIVAYALGLPLGLLLVLTDPKGLKPMPVFNRVLGIVINLLRSVPFIILLVWVMPVTRAIMGTTIGSKATLVPLFIAAAPFIARMVESSAREVNQGVIEAAQAMGASPWEILVKVILPEAKPSLIVGAAIAVTTILGYSAMAGIVGGGGLGAIAINYGYYRSNSNVMLVMVVLLVLIVQVFQEVGTRIAQRLDRRIRERD
ncbi:MAG: ABC transporter permease [Clostridia bacterium]|nr:ABC transporter permease [Clostridia bacterium]